MRYTSSDLARHKLDQTAFKLGIQLWCVAVKQISFQGAVVMGAVGKKGLTGHTFPICQQVPSLGKALLGCQ